MRRGENGERGRYWKFVHYAKASIGLVSGTGAAVVSIVLVREGTEVTVPAILLIALLALLSGLMIDAPGTTTLASRVIDALPWTPGRPPDPPSDDVE